MGTRHRPRHQYARRQNVHRGLSQETKQTRVASTAMTCRNEPFSLSVFMNHFQQGFGRLVLQTFIRVVAYWCIRIYFDVLWYS